MNFDSATVDTKTTGKVQSQEINMQTKNKSVALFFIIYSSFVILVLTFAGCGGGSKSASEPIDLVTEVASNGVPILDAPAQSLQPLKTFSNISFENYLKNGIYLSTTADNGIRLFENATSDVALTGASSGSFSTTITQEEGVDEADIVKYDGEYLYIAKNYSNQSNEDKDFSAHIRVMKRASDNSMSQLAAISPEYENQYNTIAGMYLGDDILSVLSNSNSFGIADIAFDIWHPGPQNFTIDLYDVAAPEQASKKTRFEVDGYVISSRRVDNTLIVVSSYNPTIPELIYFPQTDKEKADNYKLITEQDIASLLPTYKDQDGNQLPLVDAENCFIPQDATNRDGYDSIVTLTTINLNEPTQMSSVCINAATQGIYATPESVYMYGSVDQKQSVVHKFAIDGQNIDYQASTSFDGHLFGRGQSALRFSEQGDYLRLVVTELNENAEDRFEHKLKVFKPDAGANTMELVAELPNDSQPAKIGKPNEDIYAVRYFANKAFIVTFESIDPLYVVNLEDNQSPYVESELEIVGYSSYLHPISDNLLLGIGQNVDPNNFTPVLEDNSETVNSDDEKIVEGAKVALFDISGEAKLVKEFVFEGGYTPAEYNYHALTYIAKSAGEHRFALPIEKWSSEYSEEHGYDIWYLDSQLALFQVNDDGTNGELIHQGTVYPEDDTNIGSWNDRAIFHDDLIYYIHGSGVWQSLWSDPTQSSGPY